MSIGLFALFLCLVWAVIVLAVTAYVFYQDKQQIEQERRDEISELLDQTEQRVDAWLRREEEKLRRYQRR